MKQRGGFGGGMGGGMLGQIQKLQQDMAKAQKLQGLTGGLGIPGL